MEAKKLSVKQLSYLKLAYEVQQIAKPYQKQGKYSLTQIYLNFVVKKVPVCMNTFRKMMKEDVTFYPQFVEDYQRKVKNRYLKLLQNQSRRRVKAKKESKKGASDSVAKPERTE